MTLQETKTIFSTSADPVMRVPYASALSLEEIYFSCPSLGHVFLPPLSREPTHLSSMGNITKRAVNCPYKAQELAQELPCQEWPWTGQYQTS